MYDGPEFSTESDVNKDLADAAVPDVLQTGSPRDVDEFLIEALWTDPIHPLALASVSTWATLLRGRGVAFASHSSACHYWLYEKLSGNEYEMPALLQTGSPAEVDRYLVSTLWHDQSPSLIPPIVARWAMILSRRGPDFTSHASACHYWLFEKLSATPDELPLGHPNRRD